MYASLSIWQLDVNLLEEIANIKFDSKPKLEDTEKFKIVKDILEKNPGRNLS